MKDAMTMTKQAPCAAGVSTEKLNAVYRERVGCSVAFARAAIQLGWKAGLGLDAKGQQVLYVDTPNGQVSWHIWDTENDLLVGLPQYDGEWDGEFRGRDAIWSVWSVNTTEAELAKAKAVIACLVPNLKLARLYVLNHPTRHDEGYQEDLDDINAALKAAQEWEGK